MGPADPASVSRWSVFIVIFISLFWGVSFDREPRDVPFPGALVPTESLSFHALDLVREVGRVKVDPGSLEEERESERRLEERVRNHLGSNLLCFQPFSPVLGEKESFPLSADRPLPTYSRRKGGETMRRFVDAAAETLEKKGTEPIDAVKNDGRLDED